MLFYCCRLLIFTRSRSLLFNRLDYYIAPEVRAAALTPKYLLEEIDPYSSLKRDFCVSPQLWFIPKDRCVAQKLAELSSFVCVVSGYSLLLLNEGLFVFVLTIFFIFDNVFLFLFQGAPTSTRDKTRTTCPILLIF